MKAFFRSVTLGMFILVQSCTGQKPAPLKNSTTPRNHVKASCSSMVFEGQILSKKNVLNIFDCSGWSKLYPQLTQALNTADEVAVNNAFKIFNDSFFSSKANRKEFFEIMASAQSRGEMDTVSKLLEKSLADHRFLSQLSQVLESNNLDHQSRSTFMNVLSDSNEVNLKNLSALKNLLKAYELNKPVINGLLSDEVKNKLTIRVMSLLEDFALQMDDKSWGHLSKVVYAGDSPLKQWAVNGISGDLQVLLKVIEEKDFYKDVRFLKKSIDQGIKCTNRANTVDFTVDVGQELKHKIDGLKNDSLEDFEELLLHGLKKYLAFQEFCEEKERKQGITSFYMILKHAFSVLPSYHDYTFLKRIHQAFGDDRFVFLSFLSSRSFGALRDMLIDLNAEGKDEEFVRSLYEVLVNTSLKDLKALGELINELSVNDSKSTHWYKSWSKLWMGLEDKQKENFVNFLGFFLQDDIESSQAVSVLEDILLAFPGFSTAMAKNLAQDNYQQSLRYVIKLLSQEKVQQELSVLLSDKGLFEFVEILTRNTEVKVRARPQISISQEEQLANLVEVRNPSQQSHNVRACFASLTKKYEEDPSYYNIVNTLPDHCLSELGNVGFVGRIYLWMNASHAYFKKHYQVDDFHSADGVWAPGMLQFIFTAAVEADMSLKSANGTKGLKNNLDEIHRVLTHPKILESVHLFSRLYGETEKHIGLDKKILSFLNSKNDAQLNHVTADGLTLIKSAEPYLEVQVKNTPCETVSADLGANPCLNQNELKQGFLDILRLARRTNETGTSLVQELIKWIHPQGGIDLPFSRRTTDNHKASLDEMIRFLYDLSSPETSKDFQYQTASTSKAVKGTTLDRLEVVIRDISFLNNFYGAYFKNDVAGAKEYRKDVISSQKLLVMLDKSSGLFRSFNGLPDDSKHRLKNVRSTYWSLVELDDEYVQADGSKRRYGPFIQSLLASIAASSKVSTQKFNAYRVPSEKVVEGHNGLFLTKVVQMSGLRHLANFVRSRFDENLSALATQDFKTINENLIGRHDLSKLQSSVQSVLDKYLDADQNQLNVMVDDAVTFLAGIDSEEQKYLEEITVKTLLLLSDKRISSENMNHLGSVIEFVIEHWHDIRKLLLEIQDRKELLKLMNKLLDNVVVNPQALDRLAGVLAHSGLVKAEELSHLLSDENFTAQLTAFLEHLLSMKDFDSSLNWHETLQKLFSPGDTQWEALKGWFQTSFGQDHSKLTVSLLIKFIGEKQGENYRLRDIMDELFLNHRADLNQFLDESFKSLQLKAE